MINFKMKYIQLTIFFLFMMGVLSLYIRVEPNISYNNDPSVFDSFNIGGFDTGSCAGCHGGSTPGVVEGVGSIIIYPPSTIQGGKSFSLMVSISGFQNATSETIAVGIDDDELDNGNFTSPSAFNGTVTLDSSGNSGNISFSLTAPLIIGNYTLQAKAVAWSPTVKDFFYLVTNKTIRVVEPTDTDPPIINSVKINGKQVTNGLMISKNIFVDLDITDESAVTVIIELDENKFNIPYNETSSSFNLIISTYEIPNGDTLFNITATDSINFVNSVQYTVTINNTGVEGDITAYKLIKSEIKIGNGEVDKIWDELNAFYIPAFSSQETNGFMKALHDDFYLYVLIGYESSLEWISIEFDAILDKCMVEDHDGWAFGLTNDLSYEGDIYFVSSQFHPELDKRNDIIYESISGDEERLSYIEIARPLNTLDEEGKDIVFEEGTIYDIKVASSDPSYHKNAESIIYSFAISESTIPGIINPIPTDTTTSLTPEQIKNKNIESILIWTSIGFSFNILLILSILVIRRRS